LEKEIEKAGIALFAGGGAYVIVALLLSFIGVSGAVLHALRFGGSVVFVMFAYGQLSS